MYHAQAKMMLKRIPYAESRREAERFRTLFSRWCEERSYESASATLEPDWERMVTFYDYPRGNTGSIFGRPALWNHRSPR